MSVTTNKVEPTIILGHEWVIALRRSCVLFPSEVSRENVLSTFVLATRKLQWLPSVRLCIEQKYIHYSFQLVCRAAFFVEGEFNNYSFKMWKFTLRLKRSRYMAGHRVSTFDTHFTGLARHCWSAWWRILYDLNSVTRVLEQTLTERRSRLQDLHLVTPETWFATQPVVCVACIRG